MAIRTAEAGPQVSLGQLETLCGQRRVLESDPSATPDARQANIREITRVFDALDNQGLREPTLAYLTGFRDEVGSFTVNNIELRLKVGRMARMLQPVLERVDGYVTEYERRQQWVQENYPSYYSSSKPEGDANETKRQGEGETERDMALRLLKEAHFN